MKKLKMSCLIAFLVIATVQCHKQHSLCEDLNLIEKYEKGKVIKFERVKAAIDRIEEETKIDCPIDATIVGVLYYPDSITIDLWKKSMESKQINCD